ncbi:hypothetical protein RIR_jg32391.t1 [Rhizophagus irregularis DAOM 181602=DAOM 197198]|nr:hypothetical protein RIR_jg32391.t1 [Rhizophagus irregularis DAOM 181602=DAOM 197198]
MSNDIGEMDQIEEWQELGIDFQNSNIKNLMYRYSQLKRSIQKEILCYLEEQETDAYFEKLRASKRPQEI